MYGVARKLSNRSDVKGSMKWGGGVVPIVIYRWGVERGDDMKLFKDGEEPDNIVMWLKTFCWLKANG